MAIKVTGCWWLLASLALALPLEAQQVRLYRDGGDQVRELSGSIPLVAVGAARVSHGMTVRVQSELATIQLRRQAGTRLAYTLRLRVAAGPDAAAYLDSWPILIRRSGDVITVETGAPGQRLERGQLTLELALPAWVDRVEASTAVGDISADQLAMPLQMSTRAGNVNGGDLSGALQAVSSGGDIVIAHAGAVNARTSGSIRIDRADGPVTLATTGGEVVLRHAAAEARINSAGGGIDVEDALGPVVAYSDGGNIRLIQAAARAQLLTGGGNIVVDSAHQLECATHNGDIQLSHLLAGVRAQTDAGHINATFSPVARFAPSELVARGPIVVTLPHSLGTAVWARIRTPDGHQIRSDYAALNQRLGPNQEVVPSMVQVQGQLNGGGPSLNLLATSADITIHNP